jgi:hypothetical protein
MCNCIEAMDKHLAKVNTRIGMALMVNVMTGRKAEMQARPIVVTVKVDEKKRGRPKTALASFCPFCGIKLTT